MTSSFQCTIATVIILGLHASPVTAHYFLLELSFLEFLHAYTEILPLHIKILIPWLHFHCPYFTLLIVHACSDF